jgi:hypothetical protein
MVKENYGGIFTNRPFVLNIKCVIISAVLALFYWFLPSKNIAIAIFIIFLSYLSISWYDYFYNCSSHMYSRTFAPVGALFKPQHRDDPIHPDDINNIKDQELQDSLVKDQEAAYLKGVYQAHTLLIAPLIIVCGIKGIKLARSISKDDKIFNILSSNSLWSFNYSILTGFGLLALIYHVNRWHTPRQIS